MALCLPQGCSCAIQSSSIDIDGDGSGGNPYVLTALGTHVCTSGTRPTGIQGLEIWETDTLRTLIYDGTNWVIQSGQMPGCTAYVTGATQSINSGSATPAVLPSEVYDIGGFHASTNGFLTVPAGMAGDYMVNAALFFAASAIGQRTCRPAVTSNGSIVNGPIPDYSNFPSESTVNNSASAAGPVRLVAGAVVTLNAYQTSGGALNLVAARISLDMIRHIPALA